MIGHRHRHQQRQHPRPAVLIAFGAAALMLVGCGEARFGEQSPTPTAVATGEIERDGTPRGLSRVQRDTNRQDAGSVAVAFVVRLEVRDTRVDASPQHAALRAVPFATSRLGSTLAARAAQPSPDARWQALIDDDGWTSVVTQLESPSTRDGSKHATRVIKASPIDHFAGRRTEKQPQVRYTLKLVRSGDRANWSVSSYTTE